MKFFTAVLLAFGVIVFNQSCSYSPKNSGDAEIFEEYIDDGREKHADIEFVTDFYDIGTIKHGEVVSCVFELKNSGNIPLVIKDVVAGCGCTDTKLSKKVIRPSESATLEIVFDSKGWRGTQYKSATIVSNGLMPKRSVTLKANVVM